MKQRLINPDYSQNCGKCKMCINPDYLKIDRKPTCPKCSSEKAKLEWWNNANNNWVSCENGHRYDIRQFCDLEDIELHQRTLRIKQGFRL